MRRVMPSAPRLRRRLAPHSLNDVRCRPVRTPRRRPGKLRPLRHHETRRRQNLVRRTRRRGPSPAAPNPWAHKPPLDAQSPNARETWGGGSAPMSDFCGPAKPMRTTTAPSKTSSDRWRADVGNSDAGAMEISGPAKAMKTTAARKAGRDRRADVGNSGAAKVMKIAAAKAAVRNPPPAKPGETVASCPARKLGVVRTPPVTLESDARLSCRRKYETPERRGRLAAEAAPGGGKWGSAPGDGKRLRHGDDGAGARSRQRC